MKPRLGREVYVIFVRYGIVGISKEEVGYLGKESFVISNYNYYMEDCQEYMYNEVDVTWCTSFAKAKKVCKARFGVTKFEKAEDVDAWQAERNEE